MRLRVETGAEGPDQDRLLADLDEVEALVREGIAYARSVHGDVEPTAASTCAPSSRASSSITRTPVGT